MRPPASFSATALRSCRPIPRQAPVVAPQRLRALVHPRLVPCQAARRREVHRLSVPEVRLRGQQAVPIGLRLGSARVHGDVLLPVVVQPGFGQEHLDDALRPLVVAFAERVMPDPSFGVDEVERRPIVVRERLPDRVVVVDRDRIRDAHLAQRLADVLQVVLERELGRVHADRDEPVIPVGLVPRADVRERPEPVDAGVRAEVDDDDLPAQAVGRQRRRVEPLVRTGEGWEVPLGGRGDPVPEHRKMLTERSVPRTPGH